MMKPYSPTRESRQPALPQFGLPVTDQFSGRKRQPGSALWLPAVLPLAERLASQARSWTFRSKRSLLAKVP